MLKNVNSKTIDKKLQLWNELKVESCDVGGVVDSAFEHISH